MSTAEEDLERDKTRRTILIVVAAISVFLVGGIIYIAKQPDKASSEPQRLEGAIRAGTPEFEQYRKLIVLDNPEATWGVRPIGDVQMRLTTTVRNFTGRIITGLEIYAAVVDSEGKPVKDRIVIVIPSKSTGQMELEPNKTFAVPVTLEGIAKDADRANIKMEVSAVKFQ